MPRGPAFLQRTGERPVQPRAPRRATTRSHSVAPTVSAASASPSSTRCGRRRQQRGVLGAGRLALGAVGDDDRQHTGPLGRRAHRPPLGGCREVTAAAAGETDSRSWPRSGPRRSELTGRRQLPVRRQVPASVERASRAGSPWLAAGKLTGSSSSRSGRAERAGRVTGSARARAGESVIGLTAVPGRGRGRRASRAGEPCRATRPARRPGPAASGRRTASRPARAPPRR